MQTKLAKYLTGFISLFILLGGVFVFQQARFGDGKLHVVFCNVGQGDAVYIRTPSGKDVLVDGGPDNRVVDCLSNHMPFWDKTLDLVILSHPHADHLTGLISVLNRYTVMHYATEKVQISGVLLKKLQAELAAENITANYLKTGDRIVFSDQIEFSTFWPDQDSLEKNTIASKNQDKNELSLVQVLSYGNFKLLLTGDIDVSTLNKVESEIGDIDILKVSHHGSKTGTNEKMLKILSPEVAVISVGKNKYGHPAREVLDLFKQNGIKTLRTDNLGDIEIVSDGQSFGLTSN
jgi:competence protein ComEC